MVFILSALWWRRIRGLWKLPVGKDWLGLVLMGRAMLSISLIQFSIDGQGYVPSLLFDLRSNYGGGNEGNSDLLQKVPSSHFWTQCPQSWSRPLPTHASMGESWICMDKCGSVSWCLVGSLLLSPGYWCAQGFVCALQESVYPVLYKFYNQIPLASKVKFPGLFSVYLPDPRLGNLLWVLEIS